MQHRLERVLKMFNKTLESISELRRISIMLAIFCGICVAILLVIHHQNLIPEITTVQSSGIIESASQAIEPGLFSDEIKQTLIVGGNIYTLNGYKTIFKENQSIAFSYIEGTNHIKEITIQ